MKEADLMRMCQIEASSHGARVFRNNVGKSWVGRLVNVMGRKVTLENARYFHAGLCTGSSDLIGWTRDGRFLAIEVKTHKGNPSKEQIIFLAAVQRAGGVAFIARSPSDVRDKLA